MKSVCKQKLEIEMDWSEASAIIDCMDLLVDYDKPFHELDDWLKQVFDDESAKHMKNLFETIKKGLNG